jgi:hypothetical protein
LAGAGGVGAQGAVDDVGEMSFEHAEGFESAVTGGSAAGEQGSGVGVAAGLGEGDAVQGGVELSVAGAAESVAGAVG